MKITTTNMAQKEVEEAKKFAKIFENEKGEQLLIFTQGATDGGFELCLMMQPDPGGFFKISFGFDSIEEAKAALEGVSEESAMAMLEDPEAYINNLI